jgi:hypothetical protein
VRQLSLLVDCAPVHEATLLSLLELGLKVSYIVSYLAPTVARLSNMGFNQLQDTVTSPAHPTRTFNTTLLG